MNDEKKDSSIRRVLFDYFRVMALHGFDLTVYQADFFKPFEEGETGHDVKQADEQFSHEERADR